MLFNGASPIFRPSTVRELLLEESHGRFISKRLDLSDTSNLAAENEDDVAGTVPEP